MPKLKTHRGAAKRYKKTGSGSYKHKQANVRHILTKKPQKRKRQARGLDLVSPNDAAALTNMLPYA